MDWIERARVAIDFFAPDGADFPKLLREGIEEVRALRKENEELEQAKQSWIKLAEEENARAERLEKEKAELEEANKTYLHYISLANNSIETLEAKIDVDRDSVSMQTLKQKNTHLETTNRKLSIENDGLRVENGKLACRVAELLEARKK